MIYVIVLSAIVASLLIVAVMKTRGIRSELDFLVAGRSLRWPVLIFTLLSSWIGAGSLFAGGENAYRNGFAALWQPAGGWLGLVLIAAIAGRARRFAQFTIPDLLENRYNTTTRIFATIAIVISYTMITSYQFKGGGDILHLIFPQLSATTGMYIIAVFVITFTALAGMASVAYLDLIIGLLVTVISLIAAPILFDRAGGWDGLRKALPSSHFTLFGPLAWHQDFGFLLPTFLLLVGNQGMYQKFFSARSERDARLAVFGWILGTIVLETLIILIAVIGSSLFRSDHPREIIPLTARLGLPEIPGAILLASIFGKVISTANNYLFSPSTNLVHDIYKRFVRPQASDRHILRASRVIVVVLGIFALLQAAYFESILKAALYAYTVYGAAVTPVVVLTFFWNRVNTAGAISSIVAGTATTILWNLMNVQVIDAIYPALGASLLCLVLISLLTSPPTLKRSKQFFGS